MRSHFCSIKIFIFYAGLISITSCTQDALQTLVTTVDARVHPAKVIDVGEPGDSVGDILAFDQPLLSQQGKQVGNNSGTCIRTRVAHSFQCQWTLTLGNDSIQVAGREFEKGRHISRLSVVQADMRVSLGKWNPSIMEMAPLHKPCATGLDR